MGKKTLFNMVFDKLLSDKTREKSERVILVIAIFSFLIHLMLIYLVSLNIISNKSDSELLKSPIAAIYTPFSFILVYEVYLLIYYLPKSITTYISKQYEIITLIIIRRTFKDLANLKLSSEWFKIKYDLQFTFDLIASILIFYLLYLFYFQSQARYKGKKPEIVEGSSIASFIQLKKIIAASLVPVLLILAIYTFITWMTGTLNQSNHSTIDFKNINNIFFDQFFTVLIVVDVILLLFSFFHTDEFYKVIRNSGFIISTILIRLSFSVNGYVNTILIVFAIIYGLLILTIHNKYEKNILVVDV